MNDMEKLIWTAAFVAEFASDRAFIQKHAVNKSIEDISGYECASVADVCLKKYHEAVASDSAEEHWNS